MEYPGTTFIDHLLRYQADPECKLLLLLGEVGGVEEYRVVEAVKNEQIQDSSPCRACAATALNHLCPHLYYVAGIHLQGIRYQDTGRNNPGRPRASLHLGRIMLDNLL